jgi:hypothetical protein
MSTTTDVHTDGVAWFDAPMPPRSHECQAQSTYLTSRYSEGLLVVEQIDRCACGGLRYDEVGPWICQYEGVAEDRIPATNERGAR